MLIWMISIVIVMFSRWFEETRWEWVARFHTHMTLSIGANKILAQTNAWLNSVADADYIIDGGVVPWIVWNLVFEHHCLFLTRLGNPIIRLDITSIGSHLSCTCPALGTKLWNAMHGAVTNSALLVLLRRRYLRVGLVLEDEPASRCLRSWRRSQSLLQNTDAESIMI